METISVPTVSLVFFGLLNLGDCDSTNDSGDEWLLGEGAPKLFRFLLEVPFGEISSIELDEVLEALGNLSFCKIGILCGYCSLIRPLLLSII